MKLVFIGGVDFFVDGDVYGGMNVFVFDLGGFNFVFGGVFVILVIEFCDFDDIYGEILGGGFEVSYGMSDVFELFGLFIYVRLSGDVI